MPVGTPPTIDTWLDAELSSIIGRRRYWWRKKIFTLSTAYNMPTYDLTLAGGANAADFEQMINLYYLPTPGESKPLKFIENTDEIQALLNAGKVGPPTKYFNKPGTPLTTLVISPTPDAVYPIQGMYWACYFRKTTGQITTLTVGSVAGHGYSIGDTFVLYQNNAWAIGQITNVASGVPTGVFRLLGGDNFSVASNVPTLAITGAGVGLTVNVSAISSGPVDDSVPVPLIPEQFHYVAQLALLKRVMFYLFGENDPRYAAARDELDGTDQKPGALQRLDDFQSFSDAAQKSRPPFVPQPWATKPEKVPISR